MLNKWICYSILVFCFGCASKPVAPKISAKEVKLRTQIKKRDREISLLKDRLMLMQLKIKDSEAKKKSPSLETFRESVIVDLGKDYSLYENVVAAYRVQNLTEAKRAIDVLTKAYPESSKADDALYLGARLAFELGHYSESNEFISDLQRNYPLSNRLAAVLLLKGLASQRSGKLIEAKRFYDEVEQNYRGSSEARNALIQKRMAGLEGVRK